MTRSPHLTRLGIRLGGRVRAWRRRRGMTQVVLAGLVGRSPRWLSDLEHGAVDPHLSDLALLCEALRLQPGDLVGADDGAKRRCSMIRRCGTRSFPTSSRRCGWARSRCPTG